MRIDDRVLDFLDELNRLGIKLWVDEDQLRFRAPKGAMTPVVRDQLIAHKQAILALLQESAAVTESYVPIQPAPRSGPLPLSFSQQRLWFLDQLEGPTSAYNTGGSVRLTGRLDSIALEAAIQTIVARHDILRTTFPTIQGNPIQAIAAEQALPLQIVDFQHLSSEDQDITVQRFITEKSQEPFNLATGPLACLYLLKLQSCRVAESQSQEHTNQPPATSHQPPTTNHQPPTTNHILLISLHHIISDGWSVGLFIQELTTLYTAYVKDKNLLGLSPLPVLPIQYADFAHWQQQWLTGDVLARQLDYWRDHLARIPARLELPTDRPRPPIQTYNGSAVTFHLSHELTEQVRLLCQERQPATNNQQPITSNQQNRTLFMFFFASFAILLSRYSGQEDIVIGTPIANRNRAEIESLIGFFVNTLALRTDLAGNPIFSDLLERVRQRTLDAYMHQDIPFEQLVEELQPERSLSHSPIFQVLFTWQNMPRTELSLPELEVTPLEAESVGAKFDLDLVMEEVDGGIQGVMEYNTDLFDATTIQRMVSHFQTLIEGIVANPSAHIIDLPLMTQAEEQQILVDWNQTQIEYPLSATFPELFTQQVEKTPHAIAATFAPSPQLPATNNQQPATNNQITYAELDMQSTRIAQWLLHYKPASESVVALLEERGIAFLTAVVAILKAGCAYLPVDPNYPAERLSKVMGSSQAPIVLATEATRAKIDATLADNANQCQVLMLEDLLQNAPPVAYPLPQCDPEQLAYIIYTSGSTGTPKGAMLEHNGLLNHLYSKHDDLSLTDQDVILQNASQSFDISVWQFLAGLLVGSRIHIVDDEIARDPRLLLDTVIKEEVTIFELVPTLLRLILDQIEQSYKVVELQSTNHQPPTTNHQPPTTNYQLPKLRWLIPTGEALPPELCRRWLAVFPDIPMLNAYGPSECSDDVTLCIITEPPAPHVVNMPIGHPIANMRVYILDKALRPVPIGVAGEIYIAGVGVGRGYLNDSEQTRKAFMTDPFDPMEQGRFYKTGDLARYLPPSINGQWNIEFLGRVDHQVKVRGFRIELGEIESVLANHDAVRENVVIAWENETTELVAYIAPDGEWAGQWDEDDRLPEEIEAGLIMALRTELRQHLPAYMIPTAFVLLRTLPLTPNGKIDRRALPTPTHSTALESYVAPGTATETALATIWAKVLKREQVGIYDSFFDLGGHSLLAVQVVARIRECFQIEFTVRNIFETPTLAEIATHIDLIQQALAQRLDILTELAEDEEELEL